MTGPERARRYLARMEPAISGSGGHDRTFAAAAVLVHGFALDRETALALLTEWNGTHCRPEWSERELIHKIESALARPSDKPRGHLLGEDPSAVAHHAPPVKPAPTWPERDHERILSLLREAPVSLSDLEESSPVPPADLVDPYAILDTLFLSVSATDPNPWLCLAKEIQKPATRRRSDWQGHLERARFLVPNRMTGPKGETQDGRESVRCLANTGPRRFLVIECDFTEEQDAPLFEHLEATGATVGDLCSSVLVHLAGFAPLVMAVHSGGKSLHGWFAVLDQPESDLRRFMRWACLYGADKATWTRCQLVRMPCGIRDNGRPQSVHFFNPDSDLLQP